MIQSKLLQTIKILNKNELLEVKELLDTNLLLKGSYKKECVDLFAYIMSYYPDLDKEALRKEVVLKHVFHATERTKINRVEKTMTSLLHVIEYYIVHFLKKGKYHEVRDNLVLFKFYLDRKQLTRSEAVLKKAKNALSDNANALDTDYYFWKSTLTEETITMEDIKGQTLNKDNLIDLFNAVNEHSILKILERLSKIVSKRHYFEEYDLAIFYQLNNIIKEDSNYRNNPLLNLYNIQLWMYKTVFEDDFVEYLEAYAKQFTLIEADLDEDTLYSFASRERTCLVHRYASQPTQQNLRFIFDTYKKHLETGTLLLNGRIYSSAAVNLINYALKLDEVDWVKHFLEAWKDKIGTHDDNNSEILHLCWAMYYFAKKDYNKTEENIAIPFKNSIYLLNAKRFNIKILFERQEYDDMFNELEAFKVFLFRSIKIEKGLVKAHFEWNNNFVTNLKQIYSLKFTKNANKKAKLIEKITTKVCSDKEWLLEKLKKYSKA